MLIVLITCGKIFCVLYIMTQQTCVDQPSNFLQLLIRFLFFFKHLVSKDEYETKSLCFALRIWKHFHIFWSVKNKSEQKSSLRLAIRSADVSRWNTVLLTRLWMYFLIVSMCAQLHNVYTFVRNFTVYVCVVRGNGGEQVSAISPCAPTYPLFTQAFLW